MNSRWYYPEPPATDEELAEKAHELAAALSGVLTRLKERGMEIECEMEEAKAGFTNGITEWHFPTNLWVRVEIKKVQRL